MIFLLPCPPFVARLHSCTPTDKRLSIAQHAQFGLNKILPEFPPIHAGYLKLLRDLLPSSNLSLGSALPFKQRKLGQTTTSKQFSRSPAPEAAFPLSCEGKVSTLSWGLLHLPASFMTFSNGALHTTRTIWILYSSAWAEMRPGCISPGPGVADSHRAWLQWLVLHLPPALKHSTRGHNKMTDYSHARERKQNL